jgi:hypothetical protein
MKNLRDYSFRGWPQDAAPLDAEDVQEIFDAEAQGIRLRAFDFTSQDSIRLRMYLVERAESASADDGDADTDADAGGQAPPELVVLNVLDEAGWQEMLATLRPGFEEQLKSEGESLPPGDDASLETSREASLAASLEKFKQLKRMIGSFNWSVAYVAPRGIGPTAWDQTPFQQTQHRRRFYLLGQTLEGMQVWDTRRAVQTLRTIDRVREAPLWLQAHRQSAGIALYAALFETGESSSNVARLDLYDLPATHRAGPHLLSVMRFLDIPQTVALVAEHSQVILYDSEGASDSADPPDAGNGAEPADGPWTYPQGVVSNLAWNKKQFQLRSTTPENQEAPAESGERKAESGDRSP